MDLKLHKGKMRSAPDIGTVKSGELENMGPSRLAAAPPLDSADAAAAGTTVMWATYRKKNESTSSERRKSSVVPPSRHRTPGCMYVEAQRPVGDLALARE